MNSIIEVLKMSNEVFRSVVWSMPSWAVLTIEFGLLGLALNQIYKLAKEWRVI